MSAKMVFWWYTQFNRWHRDLSSRSSRCSTIVLFAKPLYIVHTVMRQFWFAWFVFEMTMSSAMLIQHRILIKTLATNATCVRFFTRVTANMQRQIIRLRKSSPTECAFIWFFSRVRSEIRKWKWNSDCETDVSLYYAYRMWRDILFDREKARPQRVHKWGFSPVWVRRWLNMSEFRGNAVMKNRRNVTAHENTFKV